MGRRMVMVVATSLVCTLVAPLAGMAAEHSLGLGVMYWEAIDDLAGSGFDLEESGFSGIASYQYLPKGIFTLELDLEYDPDGFNGSDGSAVSPVAFILLGHGLYGGVGLGVTFADGLENNVSDPFYVARVGWNFHILPRISLDLNLNYRANTFRGLGDVESDLITLGGFVRVKL